MDILGQRLRAERERLGLSQTAFGEIGGVQKRAQINYEAGERQPDAAYLAAIAAAGADVLYILTGQRSGSASVAPPSPRQAALLDNFEHLSEDDKRALERTASALAQSQSGHMKKAG
jgi:transcriptional regulator with XRE-family HTH domain